MEEEYKDDPEDQLAPGFFLDLKSNLSYYQQNLFFVFYTIILTEI